MTDITKKYILLYKKLTAKAQNSLPRPESIHTFDETQLINTELKIINGLIAKDGFANYRILKIRLNSELSFPDSNSIYNSYFLNNDNTVSIQRVSNTQLFFIFSIDVQDKKIPFLSSGLPNMKPGILYAMTEIVEDLDKNKFLLLSFPKFQKYRYKEHFFDDQCNSMIETVEDIMKLSAERIELKKIYQEVRSGNLKRKGFSVKNFKSTNDEQSTPISLGFFADGKFSDLEKFKQPFDEIIKAAVDQIETKALEKYNEEQKIKDKISQFIKDRKIDGGEIFNELHQYFENGRGQLIREDQSSTKKIRYWLFYDADLIKCKHQGWEAFKPLWSAICKISS